MYSPGFLETIVVTQAFMMNDAGEMLRNKKYDDDIQKCSERKDLMKLLYSKHVTFPCIHGEHLPIKK